MGSGLNNFFPNQVGFLLCWLPYSVVSLMRMTNIQIAPMTATLPSLFAKISLPWNAIYYIFSHQEIYKKFQKLIFRKKGTSSAYFASSEASKDYKKTIEPL
jgi:hypothetical protein